MDSKLPEFSLKPEDYAAIYARKSIKMENNSIQSQLSLARDMLKKNNLLLFKEYWDEESATKFSPFERQGFSELLKDAKLGKFKTLIVFRRDRLARRAPDLIEIKNLFKKYQIRILYSNIGEYQPSDSYISDFIENIIMAVDELEPQVVAERTRIGKDKKRERGEYSSGAYLPFGYVKVQKENKPFYLPDGSKTEIIKTIFSQYSLMNDTGKTSDILKHIDTGYILESNLSLKKVTNIIKNPIYAGLQFKSTSKGLLDLFSQTKDEKYNVDFNLLQQCINVEPIIDSDLWINCITKWRQNYKVTQKKTKATYLFKGILECGECKKSILLVNGKYKCQTKQCTNIEGSFLQMELIKLILHHISAEGKISRYIDKKLSEYKHEITKYQRDLNLNSLNLNEITIDFIKEFNNNSSLINKKLLLSKINEEELIKNKISYFENKTYRLVELRNDLVKSGFLENSNIVKHMLSNTQKTQELLHYLIGKVILVGKSKEISIQSIKL